jgi:gas vesicle protein
MADIDLTKAFNTDKDKTGFPTALYSTNAAKIMAFAEQIYDLNQDKFQAIINDEIYTKIEDLGENNSETINQIKSTIEENEETTSAALNDLNERITNITHPIEDIADNSKDLLNIDDSKLGAKIGDLFKIADILDGESDSDFVLDSDLGLCEAGNVYNYIRSIMGKLDNSETIKQIKNTIEENEETTSAALNDLNEKIGDFKIEELTDDEVDEIINDIFK